MPEAFVRKAAEEEWKCADTSEVWLVTILGKTITFPSHSDAVSWCRSLKLQIKVVPACGAV